MTDYPDGYSNEWREFGQDYPTTIIYTNKDRVSCSGVQNDHPKVWYTVPVTGYISCGYCEIKFARETNEFSRQTHPLGSSERD